MKHLLSKSSFHEYLEEFSVTFTRLFFLNTSTYVNKDTFGDENRKYNNA